MAGDRNFRGSPRLGIAEPLTLAEVKKINALLAAARAVLKSGTPVREGGMNVAEMFYDQLASAVQECEKGEK